MIPAQAMNEETYNSLEWVELDGGKLDTLSGLRVVGAEPVGIPQPDGAILYLQENSGRLIALELSAPGWEPLQIRTAIIVENAEKTGEY